MLTILILGCALPVVYVYALYPATLLVLSRFAPTPEARPYSGPLPSVSLVVPAYNEEDVIASKVENSLALDYPRDRLEIVIVSDGSTDGTVGYVQQVAASSVRVVAFPVRRGKTAVLNEVIPTLSGEIIVQSDANSQLDPDALRELVAAFSDPSTGCAVGQLVFINRDDPRVSLGEGLYWSYENRLKTAESRLGVLLTSNGGIYALRKSLFKPLPEHIQGDAADPLVIASRGYRVVFVPGAVAREKAAESIDVEFRRKLRIIVPGLAAWAYVRGMLAPFQPRLALALFSHKFLRWLLPWFLMSLFGLCLLPAAPLWARVLGALQVLFYALALIGFLGGERARKVRPCGVAAYFCMANAAAFVAMLQFLAGRRYALWEKSATSR